MDYKEVFFTFDMDKIIDGRVRLIDCQVERIREIRELSGLSYAKIALQYFGNRISRQTIYIICNPEKQDRQRKSSLRLHSKKKYYTKIAVTEKKQKYRNKIKGIKSVYSSL